MLHKLTSIKIYRTAIFTREKNIDASWLAFKSEGVKGVCWDAPAVELERDEFRRGAGVCLCLLGQPGRLQIRGIFPAGPRETFCSKQPNPRRRAQCQTEISTHPGFFFAPLFFPSPPSVYHRMVPANPPLSCCHMRSNCEKVGEQRILASAFIKSFSVHRTYEVCVQREIFVAAPADTS